MGYQYNGSAAVGSITVAGTPGLTEVALGYVPAYIEFTVFSGTRVLNRGAWNSLMADASVHLTTASTGVITAITSLGVSKISANTEGKSAGFSLGAAVGLADTAADVIHYVAYREAKD